MIEQSASWKKLEAHYQQCRDLDMRQLFADNPQRFEQLSRSAAGLFVDFSKNRISTETLSLLLELAKTAQLKDKISAMFRGDCINRSEQRAVLHTALRNRSNTPVMVEGHDVMPAINAVLTQMRQFSDKVRHGDYRSSGDKPFTDIVNISIGGSNLGPQMVTTALQAYAHPTLRCHFVANIDGADIDTTLRSLEPETTLFIISSKTFTTLETMTNAETAKQWLCQALGDEAVTQHFVATTAHPQAAIDFGIKPEYVFEFWDWVGGRFSLWSAIGLPIALSVGMDHFEQLLAGAHDMDQHFQSSPFGDNLPVVAAMIGLWYQNFFAVNNHAVICYDYYLRQLTDHLQQVDMESNGKSVNENGQALSYQTGGIIWGGCGTNTQHSFHQLLHQGTQWSAIDFILTANSHNPIGIHHQLLFANGLAQSAALLNGKSYQQIYQQLLEQGLNKDEAEHLARHKKTAGNRPSTTIILEQLTPYTLGSLLAFYEHKVFVQGVVWQIDSFDQWGVELGKTLATAILPALQDPTAPRHCDASTAGLIDYYHQHK